MSWQAYSDHIIGTGHSDKASIIGTQGGVWAASPEGFALGPGEDTTIAAWFQNPQPGGRMLIAGVEYFILRYDPDEGAAFLKKKDASGVTTGAVLVKCNQCILIAMHNELQQVGNTTKAVCSVADTLKSSGY
eukprot:jgi/Chlat1/327/Chrsp1S03192